VLLDDNIEYCASVLLSFSISFKVTGKSEGRVADLQNISHLENPLKRPEALYMY
jgi:hypothetical protein